MQEKNEDSISSRLTTIEAAILKLNDKIEKQSSRIASLEQGSGYSSKTFSDEAVSFSVPEPPIYVPEQDSSRAQEIVGRPQATKTESIEENIGGKWFARIGIAALVIGISFFLKYAFENNWIGPAGRVAIGIFVGIALLSLGEKTIRKYIIWGQIVSGGGIAILYLSIFSAFGFYNLISDYLAFFLMIIVTLCGVALSIRYDALSLVIISTAGGFITPLLLGFENNQNILFIYYAMLDIAILAVSIFKRWHSLNATGFAFTAFSFLVWAGDNYRDDLLFPTFMYLTLFFGIYSISSVIYNIVKKEISTGTEQILSIAVAFSYFFGSYALLESDYDAYMGFFSLVMAIYYYFFAYATRIFTPQDKNLYNFQALLAIGFITLAIPLQFDQNIITIAWLVEAVLLLALSIRINKSAIAKISIVVFSLSIFRFFFLDTAGSNVNDILIFNKFFFTALVTVATMYGSSFIIRNFFEDNDEFKGFEKRKMVASFLILANFISIYSISREIIVYYDNQIRAVRNEQSRSYSSQNTYYGGSYGGASKRNVQDENYYKKIESLENRSSITLSVFWLIYSIILIAFGMALKSKGARIGGLLLLILSILKLFFYDLWSLGTLYRIFSSISLGVVLLAISFVYQKHKEKIKEMI